MKNPRVAFFDFTSCEGCQLQVANIGEFLLDILGKIDVIEFREVMSEKWDWKEDIDLAVIEGSITTPHAVERIKQIREKSKKLMAYGSCATIGGVNGMKNNFPLDEIRKYVYGDDAKFFPTLETRAVGQVVKVDYSVPNCPVYPPEFIRALKCVLADIPFVVADQAVCVECKMNENVCMYDRGVTCLGPITRGGCNSWCINNNNICYGCRGMVSNPNTAGCKEVLDRYKIPLELIIHKMDMYNSPRQLDQPELLKV